MPAIKTSLANHRKPEEDRTMTRGTQQEKQKISSAQGTFSASRSSPRKDRERSIHTFAVPHRLESGLVAEAVLAGLDDKGEPGRDRFGALCGLGLLDRGHCCKCR